MFLFSSLKISLSYAYMLAKVILIKSSAIRIKLELKINVSKYIAKTELFHILPL